MGRKDKAEEDRVGEQGNLVRKTKDKAGMKQKESQNSRSQVSQLILLTGILSWILCEVNYFFVLNIHSYLSINVLL